MQQVRYFLALCDARNFTRAAESCNVAQPSLTRAIKMLEEELGGPLFHRERANTHLSELGRTVKPYLEQVFRQVEDAKREAQDFIRIKRTPLHLGLMCTIAPNHLIDLFCALQANHPGIELKMIDKAAPCLQKGLLAGDFDVAIYAMPEVPPDERLHYLPLYREQFLIVLHPNHRLCGQNAVRLKELDGENYLSRPNCEYDAPATRIFAEHKVQGATVYESERDDWILAMAAAGVGYAFMPEHCVNHPGVVGRPLIEPEFWREVALVTVRGRPHSPAVGALVREAMRTRWINQPAIAVTAEKRRRSNGN